MIQALAFLTWAQIGIGLLTVSQIARVARALERALNERNRRG